MEASDDQKLNDLLREAYADTREMMKAPAVFGKNALHTLGIDWEQEERTEGGLTFLHSHS